MSERTALGRVIWGTSSLAVAVLVLTVASASMASGRWWAIVPAATFIFVHTVVRAVRERTMESRLGRDYDRVLHRLLRLLADLSELAGDRYELWMVDLYLPDDSWHLKRDRWWVQRESELSRELSISLLDSRPQPSRVAIVETPHGDCYNSSAPHLWSTHRTAEDDVSPPGFTSVAATDELERNYGILLLAPLVDQLGRNCRGVMAVHVAPEADAVLQAHGALTSARGLRSVQDACSEISGFLAP